MMDTEYQLSIGAVERDTGIGRDTLRVWQRRYGYPVPQRNTRGERVYSEQQLRQLQRIKRLMAFGYRPGKLLRMQEEQLSEIEQVAEAQTSGLEISEVSQMIAAVKSVDASVVWELLQASYSHRGMTGFITETVVPLLRTVGELWAAGELQIYQEHFLSQLLERFLSVQVAELQKKAKKPRVLLATLPGEEHTLGLSMLAAMLSYHKVSVLNLGSSVPMEQISMAADQYNIDIVGVTFSGAYHYGSIRSDIEELRWRLNDDIDIWVGGEGTRRLRKLPGNTLRFTDLTRLPV